MDRDIIELVTIDSIGMALLFIDLDDTLKIFEILAAISLFCYNAVKIYSWYKNRG